MRTAKIGPDLRLQESTHEFARKVRQNLSKHLKARQMCVDDDDDDEKTQIDSRPSANS